jgi:predicted transcriptional regulator
MPSVRKGYVQFNTQLPEELRDAVQIHAIRAHQKPYQVVEAAIREYLERHTIPESQP